MNIAHREQSKFSTAEFERLVRSGGFGRTRVELRQGQIVKMNAQHVPHGTIKRLLAKALEAALQQANFPWTVDQEISVDFGDGFEPLPDIIVWDRTAAPANLTGAIPASAVRLIVEVADTTLADDLGEKRAEYAQGGLCEYWVADVKGRLIHQHAAPGSTGYTKQASHAFGTAITALAHPALQIATISLC